MRTSGNADPDQLLAGFGVPAPPPRRRNQPAAEGPVPVEIQWDAPPDLNFGFGQRANNLMDRIRDEQMRAIGLIGNADRNHPLYALDGSVTIPANGTITFNPVQIHEDYLNERTYTIRSPYDFPIALTSDLLGWINNNRNIVVTREVRLPFVAPGNVIANLRDSLSEHVSFQNRVANRDHYNAVYAALTSLHRLGRIVYANAR